MTKSVVLTSALNATNPDIVQMNMEHPITLKLAGKLINSCGIYWEREENNQADPGNQKVKISHEKASFNF